MVKVLLQTIVAVLSQMMSKENLRLVAKAMIGAAKRIVIDSENTIDDQLVLPALEKIEEAFNLVDEVPEVE